MERFDKKIQALRDEIAAENFATTRGHDRLMSLVVAKLDEAQGLATLQEIQTNRFALIDRAEMLKPANAEELATSGSANV